MLPTISAQQLTKRYGAHLAVDRVDLEVAAGEIFGFLGPNGAGKTTTIMMLLGILSPSSGTVRVLGHEMGPGALALKRRIGVVAEHQSLYGEMTVDAYLTFFAALYEVPNANARISELLGALDLAARRSSRVTSFSRGMQQKLAVARALLQAPDVLIMDEPTSGLDPYGIRQIRELIFDQKRHGCTVLLSSHILSEIEQTADRVAIIDRGRIAFAGNMADLRDRLSLEARYRLEYQGEPEAVRRALHAVPDAGAIEPDGTTRLTLVVGSPRDARAEISRAVTDAGGLVLAVERHEVDLEEAFLALTDDGVERLGRTA